MTKNPFADPKHPIDYNLKGEDVKLTERKPAQETIPAILPRQSIITASYKDIEFEPHAYRKQGTAKELLYFDKSLERLRTAGFVRHPRPQEAFGLILDGLEKKLAGALADVNNDFFASYGEWLSCAFERQGDKLITYLDPEGLVWKNDKYVKQDFKCADKQEFRIAGKASNEWIPLQEIDTNLITFLYTRPFKDLPEELQKGNRKAHITFPADGTAWPVGRAYDVSRYDVNGNGYCWASRGVRPSRAKNSPSP
jgi:hypothetical protein